MMNDMLDAETWQALGRDGGSDKSRGDHRFGTFQTMRTFLHFGDHGNFFWFSRDHVVN